MDKCLPKLYSRRRDGFALIIDIRLFYHSWPPHYFLWQHLSEAIKIIVYFANRIVFDAVKWKVRIDDQHFFIIFTQWPRKLYSLYAFLKLRDAMRNTEFHFWSRGEFRNENSFNFISASFPLTFDEWSELKEDRHCRKNFIFHFCFIPYKRVGCKKM